MVRSYRRAPSLPEPVFLEEWRASIVRPLGRTNMVTNPSVETNSTGYTLSNTGSLNRVTTYAYHGAYSLQVSNITGTTDGVYYGTVSLTSGTTYAASVKFYAPNHAGQTFRIAFGSTAGAMLASASFVATGRWQWVSVLWTETSTTTRRVYITRNGVAPTTTFYLDGLQVEACETGAYFPTTYIDGDQQGLLGAIELPPYYWTGTPHASTSVRSGQTRAGGRVVPLASYGFRLTSIQGLGLAPVQPITTPFAQLDGAQFLDIRKTERAVTLAGRWGAPTPRMKERQIAALAADLDRDLIATRQPLTLLVEPMYEGQPIRAPFVVPGLSYGGGMEGSLDGLPSEESAIAFTQYQPRADAGESGAALDGQDTIPSGTDDGFLQRTAAGVWGFPSGSAASLTITKALALGVDGTIYIGGGFLNGAGIANADYIISWNGTAYSALGTGMNDEVRAFAISPGGTLYAGGAFTTAGGGGANRIASWNGSAWSALGTGMDAPVEALAFGPTGILYAGGQFTTAGGGAATYVAQWSGSAWSAVSTGMNNHVYALTIGLDGNLYAAGAFTTAGGGSATRVAMWNGSAWTALGTGMNNSVFALAAGPNGLIYAGGDFTTAGGVSASKVAVWNGVQWSALGSGMNNTVRTLAVDQRTGILYAGGKFTTAGGLTIRGFAAWNGSSWTRGDLTLSSSGDTYALLPRLDGALFLGGATFVTTLLSATAAGAATCTNLGTTQAFPRLVVNGPSSGTGTLSYLGNATTGATIFLDLDVLSGETVTIDFSPGRLAATSTTRGNRLNEILTGSDTGSFSLQPGANTIMCLFSSSSMTAVLSWPNGLASLTDGWTR